jgi:hypothetical protein
MTIDPLTMIAVDVLGKFVIDHGATLIKESGQAAAQIASKLCELVFTQLKSDPTNAKNVERFAANPDGYQVPMTDAITENMGADSNFSAQLSLLIEEYKEAAHLFAKTTIEVSSGAVATQDSIAAGAGGVAVGGNVKGKIVIRNTNNSYASGGFDS